MLAEADNNPATVLVVEDNPGHREILCAILDHEGFGILACETAGEASEIIDRDDFNVAILDLRLPDQPGTKVLERIRASDDTVQVIMHTAHGSYASAKDSINLGAFAYLEKLGDPEELVQQIHRAARENERRVLCKTNERYRALTELAPVGLFRTDADGRYLYVNDRWRQITGLANGDSLGESWAAGIHPRDRQQVVAEWRQAVAAGEQFAARFRFGTDVAARTVYCQAIPEAESGGVSGYVGTVTDLDEPQASPVRF